jgi:NADH-quinone oxidoreductase subunit B
VKIEREKIRASLPLDEPEANKDLYVRQVRARDLLRGDIEGVDLEKLVEESLLTTRLDKVLNWGRANAVFPATFGLACCAIEMMSVVSPRYDIARFGAEAMRASPRQADMLILSGRVSIKMAPVVRRLYDQMLEPKWVVAMGACSSSGGMFSNYAVVQGADKFLPVDIHVPGCPPRPEALLYGFNKLQRLIMGNPDLGWRTRYSAHGTEEWARDLGDVTDEARDAYAAARRVAADAESAGESEPGRGTGHPVSAAPMEPVDVPGPPQERADVPARKQKVEQGRFI